MGGFGAWDLRVWGLGFEGLGLGIWDSGSKDYRSASLIRNFSRAEG